MLSQLHVDSYHTYYYDISSIINKGLKIINNCFSLNIWAENTRIQKSRGFRKEGFRCQHEKKIYAVKQFKEQDLSDRNSDRHFKIFDYFKPEHSTMLRLKVLLFQ